MMAVLDCRSCGENVVSVLQQNEDRAAGAAASCSKSKASHVCLAVGGLYVFDGDRFKVLIVMSQSLRAQQSAL